MLLAIDARLSAPPSRPLVFRDVTLYGKVFCHYDVVATCSRDEQDFYVTWFRRYGLFDFVDALVELREINPDVEITDGLLTEFTLQPMIAAIRR